MLILFSISSLISNAQEGLTPLMPAPEIDTLQPALERQMIYYQLLSGTLNSEFSYQSFQLPEFDFNSALTNRWSYNYDGFSFNNSRLNLFNPGGFGFYPTLFLRDATVLSSGEYQFSDKFKIGGFSYGANSVFSAPFPNQGLNNYDYRGATMFMQYKVSKNFKIETSVNVQQGR